MDLKRIKSDLADRCISEDDTRELIAEVEFLTKVAEQVQTVVEITQFDDIYGFCIDSSMTPAQTPELAQYLKRGKE
jgi:hypothetical protein